MDQGGDGMTPALIAIIAMPFIVLVFAFFRLSIVIQIRVWTTP